MIAASRDVFVANAERDAVGFIRMEIDTMQTYFGTIGTQAALIGGFAFSLVSSDINTLWADAGSFFFMASVSCSLLMMTVVYSSVVSSHAATMGLTGMQPSDVRKTVVLMRRDQWFVEFSFYSGICTFMLALCLRVWASPTMHMAWKISCMVVLFLMGCVGTLTSAMRGYKRYRTVHVKTSVVSGDEFLNINHHNKMHTVAAEAVEAAARAPTESNSTGELVAGVIRGRMHAAIDKLENLSGIDIDGDGHIKSSKFQRQTTLAGNSFTEAMSNYRAPREDMSITGGVEAVPASTT